MTKVKKSFFEKLTGSRSIDSSEGGSFERERPMNISNIYSEDTAEAEMIINSSPRMMEREEMHSAPIQEDGEGQLTIDVYQTDNDVVIRSTIAGVKPEDLDVSINNDMITIRGERRKDEEVSEENYYYQECYWGSFSRSVILPVDVLADKIEASMKNGILTIRLPKADNTKTKKIQVRGF
ncbi:MAG: Protein containing Heat shock protein Hsp20 protein [Candidatus Moranbacteria bacterium GW2011_GWF2_36_839]|nr:MAG: Protein containing Heat shock protein Hsp20 protein [Candidatus Moranbacteria bacterium GW2011_GWF1_36_78]KKQ17482.1 MAG: Protein containing Heat shock protein Hsp20 protein [Candidatus Moranbacteria bacterium GW2011_GWF2_36_839]HAT73949.1 heat-shock protein Hsp20 [Candidatus Moranbacteria bacterium]HBY10525.1 heat-shock protein Hsp20 [Candidatus Moranbacteria bacterium]